MTEISDLNSFLPEIVGHAPGALLELESFTCLSLSVHQPHDGYPFPSALIGQHYYIKCLQAKSQEPYRI